MQRPPIPLKDPNKAALLAWLVPGLGHFYQGRTAKGILYMTCILGLYAAGMVLGEGRVAYWRWVDPRANFEAFRLPFLCQFWIGLPGVTALIQATLKCYDHVPVLGGLLAEPAINVINGMHSRLNRMMEMGTLYTEIAGLLNVLAIFDAYEGPAVVDEPAPAPAAVPAPVVELKPEAGA